MRIEDATKGELLWWLREGPGALACDEGEIIRDIAQRRAEQAFERSQAAAARYDRALEQFVSIRKPYCDVPLVQIPDTVLAECAALEAEMQAAGKDEERYYKEYARWDKCWENMA